MFTAILLIIVLIVVGPFLFRYRGTMGIAKDYKRFQDTDTTLFQKYGGLQTIMSVVDSAVSALVAEPTLAEPFAVVNTPGHRSGVMLKACLDLQFSNLFGFDCPYPSKTFTRGVVVKARSMKDSHVGLKITTAQFNKFVEILVNTLLSAGVVKADVDALGPALTAMAKDIVEVV